jgi:nucleotide-binding universal stress UspA family protein
MKTILVPTDFSSAAQQAADFAAALCRELKTKLILFHAYLLPVTVGEMPFVMVTGEELQKSTEAGLKKEADRISTTSEIQIESVGRMGIALDEIKDLVKERNIDLVVMASKETEGLDRIFGSTTNAAINSISKPLLIIPETAVFNGFSKISYASDFHFQDSLECFELLLYFVRHFNARLSILHVQKGGRALTGDQEAGKSRLESIFGEIDHDYHLIEYPEFEKGIVSYLEKEKADLLVVVAREHNFFERIFGHHTSQDLSVKTHLPLLILHDKG